MPVSPADFDYVRKSIREKSGIALDDGKEYLVESRLSPIAHQEGFPSLQELISHLRAHLHNDLWPKIVDALTTNETLFFRDRHPFDALKNFIIPELIEKRSGEQRLNLWCAASSSVSLVKGFCPVPVRVYAHFGHGFRTSQNTSVAHGQNPIRHR